MQPRPHVSQRMVTRTAFARLLCVLTAGVVPSLVHGQATSDVFLVEIDRAGGSMTFGRPANLTNRDGYDNQPSFTPDGRAIFYTSMRTGQADIWLYVIDRGSNAPATSTPESEYSPTVMPGGQWISTVRVEMDSTQRLWRFARGGRNPSVILENIKPVGYYAWIDASTVAVFVLGDPATLQIADVTSGTAEIVASQIGRSIHHVPNERAVSFLHRVSRDEPWIAVYNLDSRETRRLTQPVGDNEFYAWLPDGGLLQGEGAKLYLWTEASPSWHEVADFTGSLAGISRLAISPAGNRIAIVAVRP